MSRRTSCVAPGSEPEASVATPARAKRSLREAASVVAMAQRSFLRVELFGPPVVCGRAKGEIGTAPLGFSALGLRFSRLLICSRLATAMSPRRLRMVKRLMRDRPPALAGSAAVRRRKSLRTLAISFRLRGSCANGVTANNLSRYRAFSAASAGPAAHGRFASESVEQVPHGEPLADVGIGVERAAGIERASGYAWDETARRTAAVLREAADA